MARYLYNTTPQIKKVNTNDTDSHFDKNFAKYHFNSGKKTLMSDRFNKSFSFSIDSPPSKKAVVVLATSPRAPVLCSDMFLQGGVNKFAIFF